MDIIGMLSSPLGLTLLGSAGAVAAPVIAAMLNDRHETQSVTVSGSTTGNITHDNSISVTVRNEDNRIVHQTTAPATSEELGFDGPTILLLGFVASVVMALVLWFLAESWAAVSLLLTTALVAAAVLTAVGFVRYPYKKGRATYLFEALAPVIAAIWAVAALSVPVDAVPSLPEIREAARDLAWRDAVVAVWQLSWPMGLLSYLMRFTGLILALIMVAQGFRTTLGFLAIASGARSENEARMARGIRWAGVQPPRSWEWLMTLLLLVLVGFLIYPGSVGLLSSYLQT